MAKLAIKIVKYENSSYLSPRQLDIDWKTDESLVGIYGAKGSGKSLFCHLLAGLLDPTSGKILFQGIDYTRPRMRRKRNFYLLSPPIDFSEEVKEFFFRCGRLRNLSRSFIISKINQVVTDFEIEDWLQKKIIFLSDFEKKKMGLLSLLIGNPKVLLLDDFLEDIPYDCREWKLLFKKLVRETTVLLTGRCKKKISFYSRKSFEIDQHGISRLKPVGDFFQINRPKLSMNWWIEVRNNFDRVVKVLSDQPYLKDHRITFKSLEKNQLILTSKKNFSILPILNQITLAKIEVTGFSSYLK